MDRKHLNFIFTSIVINIFIHLLLFIAIYISSKRFLFFSLFLLGVNLLLGFILYNQDISYWHRITDLQSEKLQTQVIIRLDFCSPHIPLSLCRVLYNKPVIASEMIVGRFIGQYSEENIISFARLPFLPIFVFFFYAGVISFLAFMKRSNWKTIGIIWLFVYGGIGIFGGYDQKLAIANIGLIIYMIFHGFYSLFKLLTKQ